MCSRTLLVTFFTVMLCVTCLGQTSFQGLTPGKSTRADVEGVLGQAVNKVSETLIEYRARPNTSKVFVQYRKDSPVIERIEVLCWLESSTCLDFMKSIGLSLPSSPDIRSYNGDKWRFLYGEPRFVATSGNTSDIHDNINEPPPTRLAFYSRELYEAEFARVEAVNRGEIAGVVKLNGNAVAGATIDFYRTDLSVPTPLAVKTDRNGAFGIAGLRGTYVLAASGPGMQWTYVKGLQIPVTAHLEINAQPGDGSRPTRDQVMAAIR